MKRVTTATMAARGAGVAGTAEAAAGVEGTLFLLR